MTFQFPIVSMEQLRTMPPGVYQIEKGGTPIVERGRVLLARINPDGTPYVRWVDQEWPI